jgi:hypothetical protein
MEEKYVMLCLDPGQSRDPFAIVALEITMHPVRELLGPQRGILNKTRIDYRVKLLERMLDKPYPECVSRVTDLLLKMGAQLEEENPTVILVADVTGVGRPVKDYILENWSQAAAGRVVNLQPGWINIHGGDTYHYDRPFMHVPKREIVSSLVVAVEQGEFTIPRKEKLRKEFLQEMRTFRADITPGPRTTPTAIGGRRTKTTCYLRRGVASGYSRVSTYPRATTKEATPTSPNPSNFRPAPTAHYHRYHKEYQ